ncbi:MAG: C45 family autoproteolytic acyltransferase/hydrolase [Candidatus Ratteibacteria bacterium]|jgi:hypothetical protein
MHLVKVQGSSESAGEYTGFLVKDYLEQIRNIKVDRSRVQAFTEILRSVAPAWLEEAVAYSRSAEISLETLLMANCKDGLAPAQISGGGCTSFIISSSRSSQNIPLLMKIRDERPLYQIAGTKEIPGTYRYVFGTNAGNLGIAHFLNESGLAGANNTGSFLSSGIRGLGLNDCHVLRFVAERASTCREALEIIKTLIKEGYCGNTGFRRGMIFLFADIQGKGLIIENSAEHYSYRFIKSGVILRTNHFLLPTMQRVVGENPNPVSSKSSKIRYNRAKEVIRGKKRISSDDLFHISRDTKNLPFALCNGTDTFPWKTLSCFVHELHPKEPCTWVCNGLPLTTEYVSVSP